jgi:Uma2 family endonuclease
VAIRKPAPPPELERERALVERELAFYRWLMTPRGELTIEDWFSMPDDGKQYELFEGKLVLMTAPGKRHQRILKKIIASFDRYEDEHGGFAVMAPFGVGLSEQMGFEPDAVYVTPAREEIVSDRGVEGVPDIVVEVLSPSTRRYDLRTKLRTYLEHGVSEVWIVDPDDCTTAVHRPGEPPVSAPFGERIPSTLVDLGDAGLARFRQ